MSARRNSRKKPSPRKPPLLSHPPPPKPAPFLPSVLLLILVILLCVCFILYIPILRQGVQAGWARLRYEVDDVTGAGMEKLPIYPLEILEWSTSYLHPNRCQVFDGEWARIPQTTICINSDGFRDREFALAKPADTTRMIMLGDSFTFGWGVELEDSLPKQLEKTLNNQVNENIEVLNLGVPGASISPEVNFLESTGLKYNPDYVLIYFVSNDLENSDEAHDINERIIEAHISENPEISRAEAESQTFNLAQEKLNENFAAQNLTSLKTTFFPVLRRLRDHAQQENFTTIFILVNDHYFENQGEFIEQSSTELGFVVLYLEDDRHEDYNHFNMVLHPRDAHPSPLANRIRAELLAEQLLEMFPEMSAESS